MNKFQTSIKNIFQRKDTSGLSIFGHGHNFDWKIMLSIFLLVVIIVVAFNTQLYLGVKAGDIFQSQNSSYTQPVLINRKFLEQILQKFSPRAENLKALQTQKPVLVDPSL